METANTRVPFKTATEKFQFVVQESSTITSDMHELAQCSFQITGSRMKQLQELNPRLAQWISDCEASYASLFECGAALRELYGEDAPPPQPKLAFDLYVVFGMRILICHKQDMKFSLNYFLRFLNQLYEDRALLASLIGSHWISQTFRLSTEVNNNGVLFSLREPGDESKFITADLSVLSSVNFPPLMIWEKCRLGWLFRDHLCCNFHQRSRTPWKGNPCR